MKNKQRKELSEMRRKIEEGEPEMEDLTGLDYNNAKMEEKKMNNYKDTRPEPNELLKMVYAIYLQTMEEMAPEKTPKTFEEYTEQCKKWAEEDKVGGNMKKQENVKMSRCDYCRESFKEEELIKTWDNNSGDDLKVCKGCYEEPYSLEYLEEYAVQLEDEISEMEQMGMKEKLIDDARCELEGVDRQIRKWQALV